MFTIHCSHCGARTLIWPSQVDAVENGGAGIVVSFHCSAGHRGTFVTGRRSTTSLAATA